MTAGATPAIPAPLREAAQDALETALGRSHRQDEVRGRTGGPASNARLAASTGLLLLALSLAELVTLISINRLIEWHLALGAALIAPAAFKTAVTGWRLLGYYTAAGPSGPAYKKAGPPPLLLRLLGPLVVVSTALLLGTGLWVVYLGPEGSRRPQLPGGLFGVNVITFHQGSFILWAVATGLHVLGRFIPALQLTVIRVAGAPVARGVALRWLSLACATLISIASVVLILQHTGGWVSAMAGP